MGELPIKMGVLPIKMGVLPIKMVGGERLLNRLALRFATRFSASLRYAV